ncbi:right-handed parallel beta-helix repeat-containing protein [Microbulbifer sp. A4B17]|uniref:right-handed parallel beta-helix repeat-containing protein n=1 Tax=Microbulbifer sp. A4B17 TaxID=359370 RepID=UPI001EE03611|nr:right-handed parallel beta-helix repeat-containing protein [Microbulbifer sp. A4B17]
MGITNQDIYKQLALVLALSASTEVLAVECGDTISKPTTLTQDLSCELSTANPVALTIVGPLGSLNMAGFELGCVSLDPTQTEFYAVEFQGTSAILSNGQLTNCTNGIITSSSGFHSISNIVIDNAQRNAILLFGDGNTIINVDITGPATSTIFDGIEVFGDYNVISRSSVLGGGDEGIEILGDYNNISFTTVSGFSEDGFEVDGNFTFISNSIIENNVETGAILNGNFTHMSQNSVTGNGQAGINLSGASNSTIADNIVANNGLLALSDNGGIIVTDPDSMDNRIIGNTLTGNQQFDLADPFDPTCSGTNLWKGNQFTTSNPTCLE